MFIDFEYGKEETARLPYYLSSAITSTNNEGRTIQGFEVRSMIALMAMTVDILHLVVRGCIGPVQRKKARITPTMIVSKYRAMAMPTLLFVTK